MLRFEIPPDDVFSAILEESLAFAAEEIKDLLEAEDRQLYESILLCGHRIFRPKIALQTLDHLLACHRKPELYVLNDYHYLLIYDVLHYFSSIHHQEVKSAKGGKARREASAVGPFRIEKIDFDAIVDLYFWDTDFLLPSEEMIELGIEGRQFMEMSPEAFSISQGLQPHPEELALHVWDDTTQEISKSEYFAETSKRYPDFSVED
jgi:hypothetical protein